MSKSFIPTREDALVVWSNAFASGIASLTTAVGISSSQSTAFATLNTAWVTAHTVANNSATRSPANIILKDQAKAAMIANARELAGIVQKFPGTTDDARSVLGLNVPKPGPTPTPVATEAPELTVASVVGHIINVRVREKDAEKRGKPEFTFGAVVMSYIGATPPETAAGWQYEGTPTRADFPIQMSGTLAAGTKVYLTAAWQNPRGILGPLCTPVTTYIAYGGLPFAEAA